MKIGEEALAVVRNGLGYRIIPCTVTGVMDTAKSVSTGKKDFKEVKRFYQIDSEIDLYDNMVSEENLFTLEDKEKAISRRNELLGIKSKKEIEDEKLAKAKTILEGIKEKGKWSTVEDIEETLTNLIKEGKLSVTEPSTSLAISHYDPFEEMSKRFNAMDRMLTRLF